MKWKSAGRRGEVFSEDGDYICIVQTVRIDSIKIEPWREGEENFALILNAPVMLEALEAIATHKSPRWGGLGDMIKAYSQCKAIARAAIAAAKGEDNDLES